MIKKHRALIFALVFIFCLGGCKQKPDPDRPANAYIGDSVTSVDVAHYLSGQTVKWVVEGEEVDSLRDWVSKLEYELYEFEEGQSPGDGDGGEFYDFILTEEGNPGFCYVINGREDCYLLIEGYWFSVKNPSNPPVTEPNRE